MRFLSLNIQILFVSENISPLQISARKGLKLITCLLIVMISSRLNSNIKCYMQNEYQNLYEILDIV